MRPRSRATCGAEGRDPIRPFEFLRFRRYQRLPALQEIRVLSQSFTRPTFEELEKSLGYSFRDKGHLREALTHKSFYHENRGIAASYNERLEFLGDSVIGLIIVEYLFRMAQGHTEAVLAKMKSFLVSEPVLADIAESIFLSRHLLLGKGEDSTGGRNKKSFLADALEAVIGAVYLDGGYERTREVVLKIFCDRID